MSEPIYIKPELTHQEYVFIKGLVADYAIKENPYSNTVISILKKFNNDDKAIKFLQNQHEKIKK